MKKSKCDKFKLKKLGGKKRKKLHNSKIQILSKLKNVKGHRPSANLREERKIFLVLVHTVLLSNGANSGFTLFITPLRKSLHYPHRTGKMSVIEPILFMCFEWMKMTSPYMLNIPKHIPCSLHNVQTFRIPQRGFVECKCQVCPFSQQNWV